MNLSKAQMDGLTSGENAYGLPGNQYKFDVGVDLKKRDAPKGGQVATWSLTGVGLNELDFLTFATTDLPTRDQDVYGLIHLQGLGSDGELSTWVKAVPEPGSMIALAAGVGLLAARRRRK